MAAPLQTKLNKDNFIRPKMTFTDKLSNDEIEDMLEDYKEVTDIYKIPLNTHLRYITTVNNVKKFRTGGVLYNNTGLPKYVILSNGKNSWSVQLKDTTFFRKMTIAEIKKEYEDLIEDLEKKVSELEKKNNDLRELCINLKNRK
jgi:uncharacterized protein YeeX (DUF496 family)